MPHSQRRPAFHVFPIVLASLLSVGGCTKERAPNLLLVVLDTTRADVLSPYGGRAQMSTLDGWAERGLVFESTTTHNPFTLGSIATLLTSLGPDLHGIKGHSGFALSDNAVTLAEVLAGEGYATAGFFSAVPVRKETGIGQGFDHFDDDFSQPYPVYDAQFQPLQQGLQGAQRRGMETVQAAASWLQEEWNRSSPFFVTVHLYDPHEPYDPLPAFREQYPDDPYLAEVASTDAMMGRLVEVLTDLGVGEETVISVVADHGEAFLEHDEAGHGAFLYETTMHVPWILRGPGVPVGRVSGLARLVDVAPTLLGACGLTSAPSFQGVDLLAEIRAGGGFELEERPAYLETYYMRFAHRWSEEIGWREGGWKFVKAPRSELYDLTADPGEETNRIESEPERAIEMERTMRVHLGRSSPYQLDARADAPDPATAARLASLGYVGSPTADDLTLRPGWEIGLSDPKDAVREWNRRQQAQAATRISRSVLAAGDLPTALAWAERALELDPEKHEARANRARALAALGRLEEAREEFRRALEQLPDDADLWQAYGVAEEQLGNGSEAQKALERALAIDPQHGLANLFMGLRLVREGRLRPALRHYQLAVLADTENLLALTELARVYFQLDEFANSRRVLEQVLSVDEANPEGLLMLGQVCQRMGDAQSTRAVLEAFVRLHPHHPETPRIREILNRL